MIQGNKAIRRLADVSIILIAALLLAGVIVDRLLPVLLFYVAKGRYAEMAAECEQAKSARELIPSRLTDDGEAETALRKSVRVQTSNCTHQEALKSVLISWGVRESTLRALELEIVTRPTAGRTDRKQNPLAVWLSAATRLILPDTVDRDLARAVREFNIRPLEVHRFEADPKFKLGQALFFDPILSGPRNVSCATCHLMAYGTSDGLAHSIGVGGDGLGPIRRMARKTDEHIRNALDLWNRDNNAVRSLFWDGRVEIVDPEGRVFRSPLGRDLPKGLDNALAVQALFPLVTPDEMLGYPNDRSAADLPAGHAGLANELGRSLQSGSDGSHIQDAHNRIMRRLLGTENKAVWQKAYVSLFREAYPRRTEFSIVDLANAIAHFEEMAFATRDSLWERHLLGDTSALSVEGRRGAVIFYGKGRCVVCHRGSLFSDFSYHSIGVFGTWPTDRAEDLGRWNATRVDKDRYKFRTPPLRNVTKTAPYFHDGSERTLTGAIERHLDPLSRSTKYNPDGSFAMTVKQIDAISPILLPRIEVSDREVDDIIAFLTSLEFEPNDLDAIIPRSVPSGLPAAYR